MNQGASQKDISEKETQNEKDVFESDNMFAGDNVSQDLPCEEKDVVKVDPLPIEAKPNMVDMQHLKCIMVKIIRRAIEDREIEMRDAGLASPRGSVCFRDVLTQLFSDEELHHQTKKDLTYPIAFLCLHNLTNEHNFLLKQHDNGQDILIMYDPSEGSSEM